MSDQFPNAINVKSMFGGQQMSQCVGHGVLAFVSRQFQNLHVHFVGHFFRMSGS